MVDALMFEKDPITTLYQRYGWLRSQDLELFEGEIRLTFRASANRSSRSIPLEWIDKNHSEARIYPLWMRWAILFSLLLGGVFLAMGLEWGTMWLSVATAFGGASIVFATLHQRGTYEALYFYHTYTGEFLFAMMRTRPKAETVEAFLKKFRNQCRIKRERAKMEAEVPSVATELHHLARLREKEIITEDELTQKKGELIEDLLQD